MHALGFLGEGQEQITRTPQLLTDCLRSVYRPGPPDNPKLASVHFLPSWTLGIIHNSLVNTARSERLRFNNY